ncbi:MAG: hypothetical protein IPP29_07690 [Bacteroidetes bacterium]|nr:hypothetical protein [Bacteroidota bacterium]
MKSIYSILFSLCVTVILSSCESQTSLLSESTIRENLEADWKPIPGTSNYGSSTSGRDVFGAFNLGNLKVIEANGVNLKNFGFGNLHHRCKTRKPHCEN